MPDTGWPDYRDIERYINRRIVDVVAPVHVGGAVSLTSTGIGATASAVTAVSNATGLWAKVRCQVNAIKTLTSDNGWSVLWIDANGSLPVFALRIVTTSVSAGGPYQVTCASPGVGANVTGNFTAAQLPANGQDVVIAGGYRNGQQQVYLFDGFGNTLSSATAAAFDGAIATGSGFVTVNGGTGSGELTLATVMDGVAVYSTTTLPTVGSSAWYSKPTSSDPNIQYLCYMNDAQSGTSPATSVAAVGTTGLTWTSGQFSYTTDSTTGNWG